MKYNPMNRRMFLQGAGKFALSIPVLPSLLTRTAYAAANSATNVRYVQWISNHGVFPQFFWPGGNYSPNNSYTANGATDVLYRPMAELPNQISQMIGTAFNPVRSKMNLIRGLHGIVNENWHNNCYPTTAANPLTDHGTAANPYSVDFVLEKSSKFYPVQAKVPVLRLTPDVNSAYKWGSYCWGVDGNGRPVRFPCYEQTSTALSALFGGGPGNNPLVDPAAAAKLKVTDLVLEDYRRIVAGNRISADDKHQLNNYMDLMSQAQKRMAITVPTACTAPSQRQQVNYEVLHENATDLAVAAMLCGATKVVAYHVYQGSATMYDDEVYHNWCHTDDPTLHTQMATWRIQQLAVLVKKMDQFTESNGKTLLDNSLVTHSNELSHPGHGDEHFKDMPVMTFGSANGIMTTGNYINYVKRPYNNLLVTVFNAMGLDSAQHERPGVVGYGQYTGYLGRNVDGKYLTDTEKRKPLPLLYKG
ncbi:hypothetical protein D3C87_110490 [compost metagenome]